MIRALLCLFFSANAFALTGSEISFRYQRLVEPWEEGSCEHAPAATFADWNVTCREGDRVLKYIVHLVLSFYPKTIHGVSAYELLYWVTDFTDPSSPKSTSTTLWIHNSETGNRLSVIEASQGVEGDLAALRLTLKPTPHS